MERERRTNVVPWQVLKHLFKALDLKNRQYQTALLKKKHFLQKTTEEESQDEDDESPDKTEGLINTDSDYNQSAVKTKPNAQEKHRKKVSPPPKHKAPKKPAPKRQPAVRKSPMVKQKADSSDPGEMDSAMQRLEELS